MPIALVPPTSHLTKFFPDKWSLVLNRFMISGQFQRHFSYREAASLVQVITHRDLGPAFVSGFTSLLLRRLSLCLSLQRCFNIRSLFIVIKVFGLMEGAKRHR